MTAITIRLPDNLLNEVDNRAQNMNITRTDYIRNSIEYMNNAFYKDERKSRLVNASEKVRQDSMRINQEFDGADYVSEA